MSPYVRPDNAPLDGPAAHGHVNLNIDGTYIKETGKACLGMILPDNTGGISRRAETYCVVRAQCKRS